MSLLKSRPAWLMLAIASGGCAAINGVFAKLTTTELTASWASYLAAAFGLDPSNSFVEYTIRGLFFALNLAFNGVMWGLFTRALTLASSTVRVSIINTSANFIVTAVLGALVFGEKLPGQWWLGAAMLVTGSVIIGMREDTEKKDLSVDAGVVPLLDRDGNIAETSSRNKDESVRLRSMGETERNSSDENGE